MNKKKVMFFLIFLVIFYIVRQGVKIKKQTQYIIKSITEGKETREKAEY